MSLLRIIYLTQGSAICMIPCMGRKFQPDIELYASTFHFCQRGRGIIQGLNKIEYRITLPVDRER